MSRDTPAASLHRGGVPSASNHERGIADVWSKWLGSMDGSLSPGGGRRRRLIGAAGLGGVVAALNVGCGGGDSASTAAATPAPTPTPAPSPTPAPAPAPAPASGTCTEIPSETAGPYPGDGTNGPNVLPVSGVVRRDIRSSVGGASGVAAGVPLTVVLNLTRAGTCAALANHAVYLWHCDALGRYSLYDAGVTAENYLRGVQVSDASGQLSFQTVFPGCYAGRWPHIHFEVFNSLAVATTGRSAGKTSQLALPQAASSAVYATTGYTGSTTNLSRLSLATDNVFSDGVTLQLASVTGDVTSGIVATLQVSVA